MMTITTTITMKTRLRQQGGSEQGEVPVSPGNIPAAPGPSTSVDSVYASQEETKRAAGKEIAVPSSREADPDMGATIVYENADEEEGADKGLKPSNIILIVVTSTTVLLSGGVAGIALYWKSFGVKGGRKRKRKGK